MGRRAATCCGPIAIALSALVVGGQSVYADGASGPAALAVADPRCEGLRDAPQVDTPAPRFSWRLVADGRDVRQTAYVLRVTEVDARGRPLAAPVESGRVVSDETLWVVLAGFTAKPRATYAWQVRVFDNHGHVSAWSEPRRFGTGLLGDKWPADWIGDGRTLPLYETAPARHFRGAFTLERLPVRARLCVSALGLAEPWLNGQRVTEDQFIPGWPDYRRRVFYAAFDVEPLLRVGDNTLGLILGDGWYSGTMIPRHQYGPQAMVSAFLDLTDEGGRVTTFATGEGWRWTDAGPITSNSIYHGETYDARRELTGWCDARPAAGVDWRPVSVRVGRHTPAAFTARISPPVRRIERLKPATVRRRGADVHVYDLGQNIAGWVRLRVKAASGREIKLRFAEMLTPDGDLFTAALRTARATALYTAKGAGLEEWEPRFTYFGFRYVELSGVEQPLDDAIEGVVVHTDLPQTGAFECSNPLLDQLWRNTLWSQKGNFLELPTDCPQRDERAGWTGDAQVFAPTALYNMDAGAFLRQWLFSVRDGLRDDPLGGYPDVAPYTGFGHGSPGWGEAGILVPWTVWLHTGDRRVLAENLPAIQHALELLAAQSPDGLRICPPTWGDWLSPGFPRYKSPPRQDLIATAYYAHAADVAARIADVLGRPDLAASDRALRDKAREAYQRAFIAPDGRVADDVQTSYLLTLAFDLAPAAQREVLAAHLVRTIAERDDHLATGFLGTPLLAPVLSAIGRPDLAYKVVQQTTYPGWLFPIQNGATTIWERWDSWTPEQGFHKDGMNSFNHYAYGSVVSWLYGAVAGLQPLAEAPGWKRFRIAPSPGGGLTHAAARVLTPHGEASSAWRIDKDRLRLVVGIPPNTRADVVLPVRETAGILLDGVPLAKNELAGTQKAEDGRPILSLPSGRYELLLPTGGPRPPLPRQAEGAWRAIKEGAREPAWYASAEARGVAAAVLLYQTPEGGWPKNVDMTRPPSAEWRADTTPDLRAPTIDNGATTSQLVFLARVNAAQATQEGAPLREACQRGLDYLLAAQYANGGWPQFFPLRPGYYTHITFNDDAMVHVLELLRDVGEGAAPYGWVDAARRERARQAVERGIDNIVRCQVKVGGQRTVWCAQHDEQTFAPAAARTFEPLSLSGDESVGIVRFLMSLPRPSPAVIAAIEDAVVWFEAARLTGIWYGTVAAPGLPGGRDRIARPDPSAPPLWAREYEIGTNRPIFCGRDAVVRYSVAEIEHERRVGYRWYTEAPRTLLSDDYPAWAARHGRPPRRSSTPR